MSPKSRDLPVAGRVNEFLEVGEFSYYTSHDPFTPVVVVAKPLAITGRLVRSARKFFRWALSRTSRGRRVINQGCEFPS